MLRPVKVLGGVFVLRRIAAPYMPALQAQPQVYPRIPHLQALFAPGLIGIPELDLIQMATTL
jgi:hypothetical protein